MEGLSGIQVPILGSQANSTEKSILLILSIVSYRILVSHLLMKREWLNMYPTL